MSAIPTVTHSQDSNVDRAREEGREVARRRLAGHRGYSTTMSEAEIAALAACHDPIDAGRVSSPIDDTDG